MRPLDVSPDSYVINTVTRYTITVNRQYDKEGYSTPWDTELVPAGSSLIIRFPQGYNTSYGYSCQVGGVSYSCTATGQNITITGLFSQARAVDMLIVTITNVLNPSPALTTTDFICYLGNDYTTESATGYASVTLLAGTLKDCTVTFNPTTANKTGSMRIYATPSNSIGSTSSVILTFPSLGYWYYDLARQEFPVTSSMTCANLTTVTNKYDLEHQSSDDLCWRNR